MGEINFAPGDGFAHLYKQNKLVQKADETTQEEETVETIEEDPLKDESVYDPTSYDATEYVVTHPTRSGLNLPETTTNNEVSDDFNLDFSNIEDRSILFDSQFWAESRYGKATGGEKGSSAGAKGPLQFLDNTWEWAQEMGWVDEGADVHDMDSSLRAQQGFMEHLYKGSRVQGGADEQAKLRRLLASYNWGEGNLQNAMNRASEETGDESNWINYAPTETTEYIKSIFDRTQKHKAEGFKSAYTWYE